MARKSVGKSVRSVVKLSIAQGEGQINKKAAKVLETPPNITANNAPKKAGSKKMSEKMDKAMDKKAGVKEGSKKDMAMDKKMGMKAPKKKKK